MVCFCDIPLRDLDIHIRKYGPFGLAFRRKFLVDQGATPVFYIAADSAVTPGSCLGARYDENFAPYGELRIAIHGTPPEAFPGLSPLMSFLDLRLFSYLKFFDSTKADDDPENFYMEREWRVVGTVKFSVPDVERVIIPRAYGPRLREACPNYNGQVTFVD